MLNVSCGQPAGNTFLPSIEFLRIELAPLMGGTIRVSLTATTVDDAAELPELLDQPIADQQVSTVEELLSLIRRHVRIDMQTALTRTN